MVSFGASKKFSKGDESLWEQVDEGIQRQIMSYDDKIMLVKVKFEKGGVGALHDHYHSQVTYVAGGKFEVTIAGETQTLTGGDTFYIPPHAKHGVVCLEGGVLVDVFSPIREDFMK
ncbi:cupin domain-containing protein [Galbibacter sp. EGI 63066]|uniref:cupin domain-containing protein n=1 Tax=Galbibacter sp. EGI 63066 TaxID=2993559 RepID=UPI002248F787|nr:cupin domain-containing protein [Galbibacter sp. EGI 63066]MCX2679293.1 cupin domain-containing protein [Galbibacter sp. EGI 63066]